MCQSISCKLKDFMAQASCGRLLLPVLHGKQNHLASQEIHPLPVGGLSKLEVYLARHWMKFHLNLEEWVRRAHQ